MHERDIVSGMSVFAAIVEGGSLAAAARRTGLSPSAVSKQLVRLERSVGAPLLLRTTRKMTVTDAGQLYFERARAILEELRAVEQEMASQHKAPHGLLRVSASLLLGQMRVLPILLAFLKKAPAVSLHLDLTDQPVDMIAQRIDVAVRITAEPPPSFVARRVGALRRVVCASPGYLRTRRAPRTPAELAAHDCLLLAGPGASEVWNFRARRASGTPERVRVTARLRVTNTLSLYEAARAGLGIAELPRYLVADDVRAGRLVTVLEPFEMTERGVFVIYAAGPLLPARVRVVADHLVRELTKALR